MISLLSAEHIIKSWLSCRARNLIGSLLICKTRKTYYRDLKNRRANEESTIKTIYRIENTLGKQTSYKNFILLSLLGISSIQHKHEQYCIPTFLLNATNNQSCRILVNISKGIIWDHFMSVFTKDEE